MVAVVACRVLVGTFFCNCGRTHPTKPHAFLFFVSSSNCRLTSSRAPEEPNSKRRRAVVVVATSVKNHKTEHQSQTCFFATAVLDCMLGVGAATVETRLDGWMDEVCHKQEETLDKERSRMSDRDDKQTIDAVTENGGQGRCRRVDGWFVSVWYRRTICVQEFFLVCMLYGNRSQGPLGFHTKVLVNLPSCLFDTHLYTRCFVVAMRRKTIP